MGILNMISNEKPLKRVYSESGKLFHEREDGLIIDEQGRYKDDYENTSIPIEELRSPLNEEEAHRRLVRIKADPKYKFIMEMADGGRRNKK